MLDVSAEAHYYREYGRDDGSGGGGKYGVCHPEITPKRASQRASRRRRAASAGLFSEGLESVKEDAHSDGLYDVVVMALSLLVVWGEHAEDIATGYFAEDGGGHPDRQDLLLQNSPCTLLFLPPFNLLLQGSMSLT